MTYLLTALALLLVALVAYIFTRPPEFRVERSALIGAAPDKVFGILKDFRQFALWSPWQKLDPAMNTTFEGPPTGVGSSLAWSGNKKAGAGRMEITRAETGVLVAMKLDFLKPFKSSNAAEYRLQAEGSGTRISWVMVGPNQLATKIMGLFVSMDAMIGKDFEEGLANLKRVAEGA